MVKEKGCTVQKGTSKNRRVGVVPEELHPSTRQMQAVCASATQRQRGHTHIPTSLEGIDNP